MRRSFNYAGTRTSSEQSTATNFVMEDDLMSVSSISSATTTPATQATAPDGDSPAVEAAENRAAKLAEKQNGGFAPKATDAAVKSANAAVGKGTNIDETV